mgnify:CR=1 FL=1
MFWKAKNKRIYLDYAAATPVRSEVVDAMRPYWSENFGNASAIHSEGVTAGKAVDEARSNVARTLRVRAEDITFTSGGTESNNLILLGSVEAIRQAGIAYSEMEIISNETEHPSILRVLEELERKGCRVLYAPIDEKGELVIGEFEKLLSPRTRIVTLAYANSETGVLTDLNRIGRIVKDYERKNGIAICFHTDASQAPLWLSVALDALGVDAMTLDAGKFGGPKGVGVLVHRKQISLEPMFFGGKQESGLRPGTENVPLLVGMAKALELAQADWKNRALKVSKLRDWLMSELERDERILVNGAKDNRLANNVNISVPGVDTEYAVIVLDAAGVAASTKSACSGRDSASSHVVNAMTGDARRANSTIRFTLGENTTKSDIKSTAKILFEHLNTLSSRANS